MTFSLVYSVRYWTAQDFYLLLTTTYLNLSYIVLLMTLIKVTSWKASVKLNCPSHDKPCWSHFDNTGSIKVITLERIHLAVPLVYCLGSFVCWHHLKACWQRNKKNEYPFLWPSPIYEKINKQIHITLFLPIRIVFFFIAITCACEKMEILKLFPCNAAAVVHHCVISAVC